MRKDVFVFAVILLIIPMTYAQLYMGTVKGYVLNITGDVEQNSNVTITILGCSGNACTGNKTTDANGFYIKTNLNLIPGNTVIVNAVKGNAFGSNTGIATGTNVGVATINVTMCTAPQKPVLNPVNDTHNNTLITMSWTTYKTGAEYDEFVFDSGTGNASAASPQIKYNSGYEVHTWKVRTCNAVCCSDYSEDSFEITNTLPAVPVILDQGNTNSNTVDFYWTHPGTDPDGDAVTIDFKIDGIITTNVTSPHQVSGLSFGSHTWGVRACDGIGCTAFAEDSFRITNNAPSTPTLTDQTHTTSTTINFQWINYSDPEANPTNNEFQLSTDSEFNTIISSSTSAVSPHQVSGLTAFTLYYWRVRTCDSSNACSAYSTDYFFVYQCPGTTTTTTKSRTNYYNITSICEPNWECGDWSSCDRGISTRSCTDFAGCTMYLPSVYQLCSGQITECETKKSKYFIGDFAYSDSYEEDLGLEENWELIFKDVSYYIRLLDSQPSGAIVFISARPREYFVPTDGAIEIDLDGDNPNDIVLKIIKQDSGRVNFAFDLIKGPEERLPLSTDKLINRITKAIEKIGYVPFWLIMIIIALLGIIYYQYNAFVKREIKVDASLMKYIKNALVRGFSEEQIRNKLLISGFAKEEIEYVFKKIKNKIK